MSTNSLHNDSLQPQKLKKSLNNRLTKNRNNHLTLPRTVPKINLPTPSPTPISPCFVHSSFDPTLLFKDIMDRCDNEPTDYSELAETTNCVRKISKKLGQARIQNVVKTVMIVTKPGDAKLISLTRELALYLITTPRFGKEHGVTVYVNKDFKDSKKFDFPGLLKSTPLVNDYLKFWTEELCSKRTEIFNFVITLGGDGTVLFTSWLFQEVVPPVLPFHLGSLGFLTNFDFNDYKTHLTNVMEKGIRVNLRMRFTCTVYRSTYNPTKAKRCGETGEIMIQNPKDSECDSYHECEMDKDLACVITKPEQSFEVLNDLVVDRGSGPYMSLLELFGDDQHLTTVQADGLVISTPTGSTAYSVSAGGSLVHPEIPALLITPICPHTLSFRPMLLPDSMELRICVPYNSRSTAWASFDGRNRVELKQGDHIKVTPSKYPFPTVCVESQSIDWFNSISRCLRWNERERQKSFVVVEEEPTEDDDGYENTNSESTENIDDYDSGFNSISTENEDKESSRMEMKNSSAIKEKQNHNHQKQQQQQHHHQQHQQHHHNQQQNHNKQHRRGNSKHTFACVRNNNSDASSSNSSEEQEWKEVVRKQKKKKSNK